jgi:hypothetical protein
VVGDESWRRLVPAAIVGEGMLSWELQSVGVIEGDEVAALQVAQIMRSHIMAVLEERRKEHNDGDQA